MPSVDLGSPAALGLILVAVGAGSYLWCAGAFAFIGKGTPAPIDPPRVLVARGPYRVVRNPMYVGVLLLVLGEAAVFGSLALVVYAALVWAVVHVFVLLYEEPTLRRLFGESYERYLRTVPRWIPRLPGRHGRDDGAAA